MNLVSIAIITYDRPHLLKFAIEAALVQSYENIELLIIDNGSTMETSKLIDSYNDKRIKVFKNTINFREFYNYPFFIATGRYLVITHDDDIMHPNFIQRELDEILNNREVVAVSCNMRGINQKGEIIIDKLNADSENIFYSKGEFWKLFKSENYIFTPTVMFDLDFMRAHSLIFEHERIGPACDQYLWYKILQKDIRFLVIPEILYDYRLHENQDSVLNGPKMNFNLSLALIEQNLSNRDELFGLFEDLFKNINRFKSVKFGTREMSKVFFLLFLSNLKLVDKFSLIFNFLFPIWERVMNRFRIEL
jgi:glycosyltransferase involved in cell wall biosynthesis